MKLKDDLHDFESPKLLLLYQNTFKPNDYVPVSFMKNILLIQSGKAPQISEQVYLEASNLVKSRWGLLRAKWEDRSDWIERRTICSVG